MATRFSSTVLPSNSTDAMFRAWVQFIEDTLVTTGGWVVTADTGQMDIATVTRPTLTNERMGYRIYRMNDALQATAPVFVRIDFGSASGTALNPGIWLTIGQGSDGTGTITDIRYNGGAITIANVATGNNTTVGVNNSYGSADTNRCSFGMFIKSISASTGMSFFIERTHDATGADTITGLIYGGILAGTRYEFSRVIMLSASQPPADNGLNYLLPTANPGTFGADVGVGVHIPIAGVALYPALGVVVTRQADFAIEAGFSMTMYGSTRTYQHLNALTTNFPMTTSQDTNSRVCIRYD